MMSRLDKIISKLRQEDTRWDAILELKLLQDKSVGPELQQLLKDPDWVVRWCVAEKLGDIGDLSSLSDLAELVADEDPHVRKNALKSLQRFGPRAVSVVVSYFQHRDADVRLSVYLLLRDMGEVAVPALEKVVFAQNWVVANRIIHLLWEIGGNSAEKTLIRLLVIPSLQKALVLLLGSLKSASALPNLLPLYDNNRLKKPLLFAFKRTGEVVFFDFIIRAFLRGEPKNQVRAEEVILKVGHHIVPAFVKYIDTDPVFVDRILAIIARLDLGQSVRLLVHNTPKAPQAIKPIKQFLSQHKGEIPELDRKGGLFAFLDSMFK